MQVRLFRWSILVLAGLAGGMALGEMAAGSRAGIDSHEPASFSHLSANPDALMPQADGAAPCLDCADSYGVAVKLRADRDRRMSDEFRELGAVDVDPPASAYPDDGYRFGGRFPDPPPEVAVDQHPAPGTLAPPPSPADSLVQTAAKD